MNKTFAILAILLLAVLVTVGVVHNKISHDPKFFWGWEYQTKEVGATIYVYSDQIGYHGYAFSYGYQGWLDKKVMSTTLWGPVFGEGCLELKTAWPFLEKYQFCG